MNIEFLTLLRKNKNPITKSPQQVSKMISDLSFLSMIVFFYVILIILEKKVKKMFIFDYFRLILECLTVKWPFLGIN